MSDKKIFPISVLEQSTDQIFYKKTFTGIIYTVTVVVLIGAIVALNFISIDINVAANGMIKSKYEHTTITASASGFLYGKALTLNQTVNIGDTLFEIQSDLLNTNIPSLNKRVQELNDMISDLQKLLVDSISQNETFTSLLYRQDALYYISQVNELETKLSYAQIAYNRSKKLYEKAVIPLAELEHIEMDYLQEKNALATLKDFQKKQWQSDLLNYTIELRDVERELNTIEIQNSETFICSPVNGTIQQLQTMFDNVYVQAGQQLAEISPNGDLIAECYISPKDIGYVKCGMPCKIQVSAFNYNDWGMLDGTIVEVFDDITLTSEQAQSYYKVYCSLNKNYLSLKNGYKGYIRKGMFVRASFCITKRTIFQLLYDKIDNWLNPNLEYGQQN